MSKNELALLAKAASIGATREYYTGKELRELRKAITKANRESREKQQ